MIKINNLEMQFSDSYFFLMVFATVLITAGGYIINDYFDRKIDMINHPDTVVLVTIIKRRWAMMFHLIFSLVGILIGLYISYKTGLLYNSILFILISGLLWFYSTTYKKQLLIGNLVVAALTAMVPLIVLLFEFPLISKEYGSVSGNIGFNMKFMGYWIIGYAIFAFLLTLIREIIKDTEDIKGDNIYDGNTLPIALGIFSTKLILIILTIIAANLIVLSVFFYFKHPLTIIYSFALLILPLLFLSFLIIKANNKKQYHYASSCVKLIMLTGVLFLVLSRFIFF